MSNDWTWLHHDGQPIARYQIFGGESPIADRFETFADVDLVLDAALGQLSGWQLATEDDDLVQRLVERGAHQIRHAHVMSVALSTPTAGIAVNTAVNLDNVGHLVPLTADSTFDAPYAALMRRAYPPGHPDAETGNDAEILTDLTRRVRGERLGPLLNGSYALVDEERPVALIIVNRVPGDPPFGGPWVSDVCRDPAPEYRGVGRALLIQAMNRLRADAEQSLSLAVTVGNPAQRVYENLGFEIAITTRRLRLPSK